MRTRPDWPRADFFAWLDRVWRERRPDIPHDTALAAEADMSHSTISSWRSGRQRPTVAKLTSLAEVLGVDPRSLWVHAGLMSADEAGLESGAPAAPPGDADAATRHLIRNSAQLDDATKADLLAMLDEQAREDAARRHSMFSRLVTAERTVRA
jgi:transcriptional regulator with XRE-family HTH domain